MSLTDKSANAVGGRTARACDGCIRLRARWYCAADDAFLCQACDASVHSANSLASRHDRVRLKTSSCYPHPPLPILDGAPTWHHGFKRKPRTPRAKPGVSGTKFEPVPVPDLDASGDEEEELLYRVPIFDPVLAEFCDDSNGLVEENITPLVAPLDNGSHASSVAAAGPAGFHELAELDVESLLGFDDEQYCMEGLGLVEVREEDEGCCQVADAGGVKMEVEGVEVVTGCHVDVKMEFCRETLDFDFEYGSPAAVERRLNLRLDCDAVMSAWGGRGCSAWIDGQRPQLSLDDWWPEPDYTGMWGGGEEAAVAYGGHVGHVALGDGRREARVTRYREKRRTRLFSKKIRYEVRKLNAEKRPRMKGRFVKRASFPPVSGFRN